MCRVPQHAIVHDLQSCCIASRVKGQLQMLTSYLKAVIHDLSFV